MFFIYQHWNKLLAQYKIWNEVVFWFTLVYPIHDSNTMFTCHCWHDVHNKNTSKILVFKVIQYHHELPCTLNSVVFELSFCSLFLKFMMTLWVRSFGVIWIMISESRSLTRFIKGTDESVTREDSSVPLMHQWSWITDPDPDNPKEMHLSLSIELSVK